MPISFHTDIDVTYGRVDRLSPLVRRVVADNPSKFTFTGTGTYLIGAGDSVAVIDPGPRDPDHVAAILAATRGETISHILITHTHGDHSPARTLLAEATDAPTYAFGPHPPAAVSEEADDLVIDLPEYEPDEPPTAEARAKAKADHIKHLPDVDFVPDCQVDDGARIETAHWTIECVHTPGHISNHLCFALTDEAAMFSGDHVMGWSTTIVPPPDGSMAHYLSSLEKVRARPEKLYYPTHGPPVPNGREHVAALRDHRLYREHQIVEQLSLGPRTVGEIVTVLYADVRRELHHAAARSVLAHLRHLEDQDRIDRSPSATPLFSLR